MKEALTQIGDFKIRGRIINNVTLEDDTAIWVKTQEDLQNMVKRFIVTEGFMT